MDPEGVTIPAHTDTDDRAVGLDPALAAQGAAEPLPLTAPDHGDVPAAPAPTADRDVHARIERASQRMAATDRRLQAHREAEQRRRAKARRAQEKLLAQKQAAESRWRHMERETERRALTRARHLAADALLDQLAQCRDGECPRVEDVLAVLPTETQRVLEKELQRRRAARRRD